MAPVAREAGASAAAMHSSEFEEVGNEYRLVRQVTGLTVDDLNVEVRGSTLAIRGQSKEGGRAVEIDLAFILPPDVASESVTAQIKDGDLNVTLTKAPPRTVPVTSHTGGYRKAVLPENVADVVGSYLKEGDLDGVVSMYHPDCKIYFPRDDPPKIGLQGIRDTFGPFMDVKPRLISTVTAKAVLGDFALLQGEWRMEDADGNVVDQGNSVEVVRRLSNGGWGYFIDCPYGPPSPAIVNARSNAEKGC